MFNFCATIDRTFGFAGFSHTMTCDESGTWKRDGKCQLEHPTYFNQSFALDQIPSSPAPRTRVYPFSLPISVGWKVCLRLSTTQDFTYIDVRATNLTDILLLVRQCVPESTFSQLFRVKRESGGIQSEAYGAKQAMKEVTNVGLNISLVAISQVKVEIGSPVDFSVVTPFVDENPLDGINQIEILSDGVTVEELDLYCQK